MCELTKQAYEADAEDSTSLDTLDSLEPPVLGRLHSDAKSSNRIYTLLHAGRVYRIFYQTLDPELGPSYVFIDSDGEWAAAAKYCITIISGDAEKLPFRNVDTLRKEDPT